MKRQVKCIELDPGQDGVEDVLPGTILTIDEVIDHNEDLAPDIEPGRYFTSEESPKCIYHSKYYEGIGFDIKDLNPDLTLSRFRASEIHNPESKFLKQLMESSNRFI